MIIDFQEIVHEQQRYPTVGDYYWGTLGIWSNLKVLRFRVSKMKDRRYPILVFLHEMIEFFMCRLAGVRMRDIDRWDKDYESQRALLNGHRSAAVKCGCTLTPTSEPGNDPHAPYYLQHQTATECERIIAKALGVNWKKYEREVESL